MAPKRPSAFEVSFPDEAASMAAAEAERAANPPQLLHARSTVIMSRSPSESVTSSSSLKRKNDGPGDIRPLKRQLLPKVAYYQKRGNPVIEDQNLFIPGEDPEEDEDEENQKPIRVLHNFTIFDPKHRNELVSLATIEEEDGLDRQFEAVGMVMPYFVNDEDEGQEEEGDLEPLQVHLGAILRYTLDYTDEKEPFYIETQFAWYILQMPSEQYRPQYEHFYTPRRLAQIIISSALRLPRQSYEAFLARFTNRVDIFGRTYLERHISESIITIQDTILEESESHRIMNVSFVKNILRKAPTPTERPRGPRRTHAAIRNRPRKAFLGNPDNSVLKAENQNTTTVTPRIANLSQGLISEELAVVGPPPPPVNKALLEAERKKTIATLGRLIRKSQKKKKLVDYEKNDRIPKTDYYTAVQVEREVYRIGDIVLVPNDATTLWNSPGLLGNDLDIPSDARIDDYFWFAKILYIIIEDQMAHIQWLTHGSGTIIGEVAHPQQLFLNDLCEHIELQSFAGKVTVHQCPKPGTVIPYDEFLCEKMFKEADGSFTSLDFNRLNLCAQSLPPDTCPVCPLVEQHDHDKLPQQLKDEKAIDNGVAVGGNNFHLEDFVLYRAETGPANIGYIVGIDLEGRRGGHVTVRKVGRISSLEKILPEGRLRDERHLFLTLEKDVVSVEHLLRVIYVPSFKSFGKPKVKLEDWLDLSYEHFYLQYEFPTLNPKSWGERRLMGWQELAVCTPCYKERLKGRKQMYSFLDQSQRQPLPTLDLFAGVGAFSRGLAEGGGCLKVTHAVEIGPSASRTFKHNSPDTIVYNQCANVMLRYAIKSHEGHKTDIPKQLDNENVPVPPPPQKGQIKVITAGFPCQSHSTLNMYKVAEDAKSNLILTTLSWIDYYRPTYAFFENVPGFLRFSLNARQATRHRVTGGIDMGGLKLVVRALVDMGYQVRYGLLQAGNYGTPQRRVRFFLVAALEDHPLPELPQPTHDFPTVGGLEIKQDPHNIQPIRTARGTAAHPFVSIESAIGDLPRFDWRNPDPRSETADKKKERRKRAETIPSIECKKSEPYCGLRGQNVQYRHQEPRTTYQQTARSKQTLDIQHYTRCFVPKKVERVLYIPLKPDADYRSLPYEKYEWQFADPSSSIGRMNYRPGAYGRLDKHSFFPTTVTNMEPTAKQSRVLHPDCYRMVTVRELARSQGFPDNFVFKAIGDNVITMHRQIGNAVPLPVAHALGRQLRKALFQQWKAKLDDAIVIEDDEAMDQHHLEVPDEAEYEDDDMYVD